MGKEVVHIPLLRRVAWAGAALFLVLLPLLEGWGLLRLNNAAFSDLFPLWSDEIYYWHQAATFARADFHSGYYTVGEQPAPARFARYYAWGLVIPTFYGMIARVVGWPLWIMPLVNLVCLSVSLAVWIGLIRPTLRQLGAAVLFIATFAPFLCFIPSSMIEILQMAWAVLLAAAFIGLMAKARTADAASWGVLALLIGIWAANFRITWGLLLPLAAGLWLQRWGWRGVSLGLIGGLALVTALYGFSNWTAAPYSEFATHLSAFGDSLEAGLHATWQHSHANLDALLRGHSLEIGLRMQTLGLWLALCAAAAWRWFTASRSDTPASYTLAELAVHTLLLPGTLILSVVMYDVGGWRDYRVLGPHVLMSGLLLIGRRRWGVVAVLLVSSALLMPTALTTAQEWTHDYLQQHNKITQVQEWRERLRPFVQYEARPRRGWCNTVTHTAYFAFVPTAILLAFDPGMGLSMLLTDNDAHLPFKARYLLLDNDFIRRHEGRLRLKTLLPVPGGNLYLNESVQCPPPRPAP